MFLLIGSQTWDWPDKWRLSSCCLGRQLTWRRLPWMCQVIIRLRVLQYIQVILYNIISQYIGVATLNLPSCLHFFQRFHSSMLSSLMFFEPLPFRGTGMTWVNIPMRPFYRKGCDPQNQPIYGLFEGAWRKEMGLNPIPPLDASVYTHVTMCSNMKAVWRTSYLFKNPVAWGW